MRVASLILLSFFSLVILAQEDTTDSKKEWSVALDGQSLLGSKGGLGYSAKASLRYKIFEIGVSAGFKERKIENKGRYDYINSKGHWIEPNATLLIPLFYWKVARKHVGISRAYATINAGYGFTTYDNDYGVVFEGTGPYRPYIYEENYEGLKTHYASISVGNRIEILNHIRIEFGIRVFQHIDRVSRNSEGRRFPIRVTPMNGSSPLGTYLSLGAMI